jgi:CHASE2 domain-containing sensor protein
VVVIGATHPGSGDFWLTPSGVRPGVEMVANSIRYAPVQGGNQSLAQRLGYRALALFLFGTFILFERKLRGLPATVLSVGTALVTIAVVMSVTQTLAVFDALEAAILLIVLYKALDVIGEAISEVCRTRERFGPGWKGRGETLAALLRREP